MAKPSRPKRSAFEREISTTPSPWPSATARPSPPEPLTKRTSPGSHSTRAPWPERSRTPASKSRWTSASPAAPPEAGGLPPPEPEP